MASISAKTTCIGWEDFLALHRPQLLSIGLPEHLWERLYKKLAPIPSCDATEAFELHKDEQFVSLGRWSLHARRALQKLGDVFLIEHAWSSDGNAAAKKSLEKSPKLLTRVKEMLGHKENNPDDEAAGEALLDSSLVLSQIGGINEEKAKEALEATDGDLIEALCQITDDSYETKKSSKSNRSKIMTFEEFKTGFLHGVGMEKAKLLSEEYIEKMYSRYKREKEEYPESMGFGYGTTSSYSWSEEEEGAMTVLVSIPVTVKKRDVVSKLTTKRWTLGLKGSAPIIDGEFYGNVCPDESFWTFDSPGVLVMTLQKPENEESELWPVLIKGEKHLTEKEISDQAREKDQRSDFELSSVLNNMWYYNQTYQVMTPEGDKRKPVWYIMDKFGSAIVHNTQPNVKCSPFAFSATGVFYSLLWPIRDLDKGEMCTRNFCPALSGTETNLQREGRLLAFSPSLPESVPTAFVVELSKFPLAAKENNIVINVSSLETPAASQNCLQLKGKKLNLKFFMETNGKEKRPVLRDLGCTLVESMSEAEAVWLEKWNTLGKKVGSEARVNRLAGEEHLLHRQLLSKQVQLVWGNVPWFPVSYDLSQQLPALCADHYTHGIASYWILRAADPSTLSIPPIVTSDLRRVIRCTEMGQLVASPYCFETVFYKKRRFCLQYSVTVKSLTPLQLLIHNTPHVEVAEKEHNPNVFFDEFESSDLVCSCTEPKKNGTLNLKVTHEEFLKHLGSNYLTKKQITWDAIQSVIHESIAKLFYAVAPSLSAFQGRSGRELCAVYGVDVLLKDTFEPLIIGIDPTPKFDSQKCFADVLFTAYGQNGECSESSNISQISVREG